jgi:hypothetical protein
MAHRSASENDRVTRRPGEVEAIGRAATCAPVRGEAYQTVVRCRRRPNRRPCPGHVRVLLTHIPERLEFWCGHCGDRGSVMAWPCAEWAEVEAPRLPPNAMEVVVPVSVFKALRGLPVDPDVARRLTGARSVGRTQVAVVLSEAEAVRLVVRARLRAESHPGDAPARHLYAASAYFRQARQRDRIAD